MTESYFFQIYIKVVIKLNSYVCETAFKPLKPIIIDNLILLLRKIKEECSFMNHSYRWWIWVLSLISLQFFIFRFMLSDILSSGKNNCFIVQTRLSNSYCILQTVSQKGSFSPTMKNKLWPSFPHCTTFQQHLVPMFLNLCNEKHLE